MKLLSLLFTALLVGCAMANTKRKYIRKAEKAQIAVNKEAEHAVARRMNRMKSVRESVKRHREAKVRVQAMKR